MVVLNKSYLIITKKLSKSILIVKLMLSDSRVGIKKAPNESLEALNGLKRLFLESIS